MIYVITTGWGMDRGIVGLLSRPEGWPPMPEDAAKEAARLFCSYAEAKTPGESVRDFLIRVWLMYKGDPLITPDDIGPNDVILQILAHRTGGTVLPFATLNDGRD